MYIMLAVAFMLLAVICGLCWGCINIGDQTIHAKLEEINETDTLCGENKHNQPKFSLTYSDASEEEKNEEEKSEEENDETSLEHQI